MIKCRGIPKHRKNRAFRRASKKFASPQIHLRKFRNPKSHLRNFRNTIPTLRKFRNPISDLRIPMVFSRKPTVSRKAKSLLKKILFKDLHNLYLFRTAHSLLWKAQHHLAKQFSHHSTPHAHQFEEATSVSRPISAMASIRGGHTNPSVSREARPSASAPQDSSQAPTILSFDGGVPSSPPQRQYSTRRPPTSPPPKPSVCRIPPKRAKTSGLGEMSRHVQLDS